LGIIGEKLKVESSGHGSLEAQISRVERLNGANDFPMIFNRKLMGLVSERGPELRILQARSELSAVIKAGAARDFPVALCVEKMWITNVVVRIRGRDSKSERLRNVSAWANQLGLQCRSIEIRVAETTFDFAGDLQFRTELRELLEGTPAGPLESNFFLGRKITLECAPPF
jgi:hypothetical protein